jgi:hypothetical protein
MIESNGAAAGHPDPFAANELVDLAIMDPEAGSTAVEYLHGLAAEWGEEAETGELDGYPFMRSTEDPTCGTVIAVSERHLILVDALVDEPGKPFLAAAWASYQDFQKIHAEIVDLSRQNSNIRSAALSLGQKRKTTAQCQDLLAALQEKVQEGMAYKATR